MTGYEDDLSAVCRCIVSSTAVSTVLNSCVDSGLN